MSVLPDHVRRFTVSLTAGPGSELFVVDSSFALVARGVDQLSATLPEGIYKVKVRRGRQEREEHLFLDHDQALRLEAPAIASPAPLSRTTRTHEYHVDAARQLSRKVHVQAGTGSTIFLMSRYWTSPGRTGGRERWHPGRGQQLLTLDGRVVADFATQSDVDLGSSDWFAACTVEVDPGTYILRRRAAVGPPIEQAVVASKGWQTEVFILLDPVLAVPEPSDPLEAQDQARTIRPDAISVLMSRDGFDPDGIDMEAVEVARLALADERRILSTELTSMLGGKFENPFLGILGAHLLVIAHDRDAAESRDPRHRDVQPGVPVDIDGLAEIVANLRRLVGRDHPDVEALSLRLPDGRQRARRAFTEPPMLKRSWSLVVAASNDRPDICPKTLYERVRSFAVAPPYFAWAADPAAAPDAAKRLATADKKFRRTAISKSAQGPSQERRTTGGVASGLESLGAPEGALEGLAFMPAGDEPPTPTGPSNVELRSLSIDSDIPRGAIDRAFGKG